MNSKFKQAFDEITASQELKKQTLDKLEQRAEPKRTFARISRKMLISLSTAAVFLICAAIAIPLSMGGKNANDGSEGNSWMDSDSESDYVLSETYYSLLKMVYSSSFYIETRDFDKLIAFVDGSLKDDEWFEWVSKSNYSARYTIRVKNTRLSEYEKALTDFAGKDIYSYSKDAEDISLKYYDAQRRIDALTAELHKLGELYSDRATTLSDLFLINSRITQVESELLDIENRLAAYDGDIGYSIVEITVYKYSFPYRDVILISVSAVVAGSAIFFVVRTVVKKKRLKKTF